jgi:two-component system, cell cycle response regulator DivK
MSKKQNTDENPPMSDDATKPSRESFFEEETDIRLSLEEDTQPPAAVEEAAEEKSQLTRNLAIVVDDDKDLGQVFAQALEMVGFETEVIHDSRKAMTQIMTRKPMLVSLDMQMPHVSGIELLLQIRAEASLTGIKIIMVSANGRIAENNDVFQMADMILIKPVTFKQIKELASRLMNG